MNRTWNQMLATLAMSVAAFVARAQLPPVTVMEASIETNGGSVHFPGSLSGRVVVQSCPKCVDQALQLDAHTHFFLNGQEISLAKLAAAALGATDKALAIHYRLKDKVVTRVDLTAFQS